LETEVLGSGAKFGESFSAAQWTIEVMTRGFVGAFVTQAGIKDESERVRPIRRRQVSEETSTGRLKFNELETEVLPTFLWS